MSTLAVAREGAAVFPNQNICAPTFSISRSSYWVYSPLSFAFAVLLGLIHRSELTVLISNLHRTKRSKTRTTYSDASWARLSSVQVLAWCSTTSSRSRESKSTNFLGDGELSETKHWRDSPWNQASNPAHFRSPFYRPELTQKEIRHQR